MGTDPLCSPIPHTDLGLLLSLLLRQPLPGGQQGHKTLSRTHQNSILLSFSWTLTLHHPSMGHFLLLGQETWLWLIRLCYA